MGAYIVRRILSGILVVWIVSVAAYGGLTLAPGNEITARLSPQVLAEMTPKQLTSEEDALGLNRPFPIRYWKWLEGTVQGNLGYSVADGTSVVSDIASRVGPTVLLMGSALLLGLFVALVLGVFAALRQNTPVDTVLGILPMVVIGIPSFVIGLAALYLFSVQLRWFPASGIHTLGSGSLWDLLRHLVLPAAVLAPVFGAPLLRYTRTSMVEALQADYVTLARAKGLRWRTVVVRHALRNAALPIITIVGLSLPDVIAGAVVVEWIFDWPGMGQLAVQAAGDRDVALVMGIALTIAVAVVVANLLADLAYVVADPRIRLG